VGDVRKVDMFSQGKSSHKFRSVATGAEPFCSVLDGRP
jgi:hypothetical protein